MGRMCSWSFTKFETHTLQNYFSHRNKHKMKLSWFQILHQIWKTIHILYHTILNCHNQNLHSIWPHFAYMRNEVAGACGVCVFWIMGGDSSSLCFLQILIITVSQNIELGIYFIHQISLFFMSKAKRKSSSSPSFELSSCVSMVRELQLLKLLLMLMISPNISLRENWALTGSQVQKVCEECFNSIRICILRSVNILH